MFEIIKGFFGGLGITSYIIIAMAIVIAVLAGGMKIQTARLHSEQTAHEVTKAQFSAFKTETKRLGEEAIKAKKAKEEKDNEDKKNADLEIKKLRGDLAATLKRMRDNRNSSSASVLPGGPPSATSPETITFTRTGLDQALRSFTSGIEDLLGEGAEAIIDLDGAKKWANSP